MLEQMFRFNKELFQICMVSCDLQIETPIMSQDECQVATLVISPDAKDGPQRDQWAVHGKLALQHQAHAMIDIGGWWIEENSMTKNKVPMTFDFTLDSRCFRANQSFMRWPNEGYRMYWEINFKRFTLVSEPTSPHLVHLALMLGMKCFILLSISGT